jgi:hypothetical protein
MNAMNRLSRRGWIGLLALLLLGCETTRNVAPDAGDTPPAGKAWVVFTVSHDKGPALPLFGATAGGAVEFWVTFTDASGKEHRATSMEKATALGSAVSEIENQWGSIHVREVHAGRVDFKTWRLIHKTGVGIREITPKYSPPERMTRVEAGSITYLGNVHARTEWGRNPFGIPLLAAGVPSWRDEAARDLDLVYQTYPQLRGRVTVRLLEGGNWITQP